MKDNADLRKEAIGQIEVYFNNGNINDGKILIDKYIDSLGKDDNILNAKAIYYILKNEFNIALDTIREGLLFNINNAELYYNMGYVYETIGEINRAYICYKEAKVVADKEELYFSIKESIERLESQNEIGVRNTSIVMLTYNNLDYTKTCINSIRNFNSIESYEIIVVDNNSTDGTVEWLQKQKYVKVIFNKENVGFPKGCNQGIEVSNPENDIFLLNNDTVIMPNSIFNLRMGLYSNEKVGATGAVSNSVSYNQQISEKYDDFDGYMDFALKNNIVDETSYEQRLKLIGFALLIKRDILNKVGILDERFTPGNFEDDDISLRIVMEGYKLLLCKDSYIHHFGSMSFGKDEYNYNKLIEINSEKFKEKWGFYSDKALNLRYDLLSKIDVSILSKDRAINILDIGCGLGAKLIKIKEIIPYVNIYGIEKNKEILNIIKDLDILTEIQSADNVEFNDLLFDVVIISDEDLYDCINNLSNNIDSNSQIIRENEIKNQENIQFTGERLVINDFVRENYSDVMYEHLSRYKLASKYVKDKIVIDAASGSGYGSFILSKAGAKHVSGFDISKEAIDSAKYNYRDSSNIEFEVGDVTKLNVPDRSKEVFVSFETIEHINCGEDLIKEASRVLKDDGIFIVSTPNRNATNPGLLCEEKPQNIYHSFEYSPLEFIGNLSCEFDIIELYGQTVNENIEFIKNKYLRKIFGKEEIDYSNMNTIKDYECRKINEFKNFEPMYLVAICKKKRLIV